MNSTAKVLIIHANLSLSDNQTAWIIRFTSWNL